MQTANSHKPSLKVDVYEKLKLWDKKRAQTLKYHKKASQQIAEAIQTKVQDSKDFVNSFQTMLEERVNQLKTYCKSSIVDSDWVLQKNKNQAYANHYELLKQMLNIEADNAKNMSQKLSKLRSLLIELKGVIDQDDSEKNKNKNDESSILVVKGNIRYLMECELPQIIEEVVHISQQVSKAFNENEQKDFYFQIDKFVRAAQRQTNKHRQIGRELVSLASASMKRQIAVQIKIRSCIEQWSEIDGPIQSAFIEQLKKKDANSLVKDFYDISQMTNVGFSQPTIQDFLINFEIQEFIEHERLKLCEVDGFYNSKIQTRIVITADLFLHLIRMNAYEPDFSLHLNPSLAIKKIKQCNLTFIQYKKKFYFKKQKQFEFNLQLNTEQDLHHMKTIIQKISNCKIE